MRVIKKNLVLLSPPLKSLDGGPYMIRNFCHGKKRVERRGHACALIKFIESCNFTSILPDIGVMEGYVLKVWSCLENDPSDAHHNFVKTLSTYKKLFHES